MQTSYKWYLNNSIIDFVAFRKQCARYYDMHSEHTETSCKEFKDEIGVDVWEEMYGD